MRFTNVVLRTARLEQLRSFYRDRLELTEAHRYAADRFTVFFGTTALTFVQTANADWPYYHYAIHIPGNAFFEAKEWIRSRVSLNIEDGQDDVFFSSWNARSLYFDDPAGNIVELIARDGSENRLSRKFTSADFRGLSEIGAACEDVIASAQTLNRLGIPTLGNAYQGFAAVGDHDGLIILKERGDRWYFSDKLVERFPFDLTIDDIGTIRFRENGFQLDQNQTSPR